MSGAEHAAVGPYRIVKAIGAGGSARIDLARIDRAYGFQRHVVIKRPLEHLRTDASVATSLRREAQLGGRLRHPNLVAVLDAGEHDGYDYLALEYIHGASLRTLMQPPGAADTGAVRALPLAAALSIVIEVARGLHEAHELTAADGTSLGLVHRDVSPNNILLGADGTVKLADFGIAKDTRVSTLSGSMRGTVTYMAPEQCRGHAFDRRADVFSLGVILFELVTARRLFWADNDVASLHKVLSGVIPDPRALVPGLAPELAAILVSAVAADPEARFATTSALADELEAFAVRTGIPTSPRFVARVMESALGVRSAPWIEAAPASVTPVAPEVEASLVAVIQSTPDEPEAEFAPPVADAEPTVVDAPSFLLDSDRTVAEPPLVITEQRRSLDPAGADVAHGAASNAARGSSVTGAKHPAAARHIGVAPQGAQTTAPKPRRGRIIVAALAIAGAASIAIVAARSASSADSEQGSEPVSGRRPDTGSAAGANGVGTASGGAPAGSSVSTEKGSDPISGQRPDTGSAAGANGVGTGADGAPGGANIGAGTGSDGDPSDGGAAATADDEPAIEIDPAGAPTETKQQRRRRIREAAAKAAAAKAATAKAGTSTETVTAAPAVPSDAGVPNDAVPARVEWKPTLLLPTDDPKPPVKRRTPP